MLPQCCSQVLPLDHCIRTAQTTRGCLLAGLVLFVYTIGLSSGSGSSASFRRKGLRDNAHRGRLVFAAGLTVVVHNLLNLKPTLTAGIFAGSFTNTPALVGAQEYLKGSVSKAELERCGSADRRLLDHVSNGRCGHDLGDQSDAAHLEG